MPMKSPVYEIAIVGGGASGMACAIAIARDIKARYGENSGLEKGVILIEAEADMGRKLLATGNGRCNLSNQYLPISAFHGADEPLIASCLSGYTCEVIRDFFAQIGLQTVVEEDRIYPRSMQARSVVMLMHQAIFESGMRIQTQTKIHDLNLQDGVYDLHTAFGQHIRAKQVVLACSMGLFSSQEVNPCMTLASKCKLSLIPVFPALVQLCCKQVRKRLSGTRVQAAYLLHPTDSVQTDPALCGEILFTDYGLSGIPTLNLSGRLAASLRTHSSVRVWLNLLPECDSQALFAALRQLRDNAPHLPVLQWGVGFLPWKLSAVLAQTALKSQKAEGIMGQLTDDDLRQLVSLAQAYPQEITQTKGFSHAQVCGGGVSLRNIDPQTMACLQHPNLYVIGELLDVHGDCGGYNLHWAWATGLRAATALVDRMVGK